jgi:rubrerythrin
VTGAREETAMSTSIPGASVWEQELYDHLSGHLDNEADIVTAYRDLAEGDTSPAFRYLATIILNDELRHHQVFADLAVAVRQDAELDPSQSPIPDLRGLAADRDRVLAITERFIQVEQDDASELRRVARMMKDVADTTLWGLLVHLMLDDTEKHIRILKFVRDHARHGAC